MRTRMVAVVLGVALAGCGGAWAAEMDTDAGRLRTIWFVAYLAEHAQQCGMSPQTAERLSAQAIDKAIAYLSANRMDDARDEAAKGERQARIDRLKAGSPACELAFMDLRMRAEPTK